MHLLNDIILREPFYLNIKTLYPCLVVFSISHELIHFFLKVCHHILEVLLIFYLFILNHVDFNNLLINGFLQDFLLVDSLIEHLLCILLLSSNLLYLLSKLQVKTDSLILLPLISSILTVKLLNLFFGLVDFIVLINYGLLAFIHLIQFDVNCFLLENGLLGLLIKADAHLIKLLFVFNVLLYQGFHLRSHVVDFLLEMRS